MGKLGAVKFWQRFNTDFALREEMRDAWKKQHYSLDQKRSVAKKEAAALWQRYHSDLEFKNTINQKLKASRSRGEITSEH